MDVKDLGLIDYSQALSLQEDLVEKRYKNKISDTVLLCSHPPVVTLGRSTTSQDVGDWKGEIHRVRRGGRATYHGPNQLIIYPIFSLEEGQTLSIPSRDVMAFLKGFELAVLKALETIGFLGFFVKEDIESDSEGRKLLNRGLWWKPQNQKGLDLQACKVVAFGIAVRKWVTYHGCAINLYNDHKAFSGIKPCGYSKNQVGNLEDIKSFDLKDLKKEIIKGLEFYFFKKE